jgi:hypothetical protein
MLDRTIVLGTIAAFAWATPVAAQAPAPASTTTAFDGTYVGVSRTVEDPMSPSASRACDRRQSVPDPLEIAGGVVRWHAQTGAAEGSVNAQGVLVMHAPLGARLDAQIDGRGTVTGRYTGFCGYQMVWQKEGK